MKRKERLLEELHKDFDQKLKFMEKYMQLSASEIKRSESVLGNCLERSVQLDKKMFSCMLEKQEYELKL